MIDSCAHEARITARQTALPHGVVPPRTRREFLRHAVWWRLESLRGYPSAARSAWYAENMLAAARALAPGESATWMELKAAGRVNAEPLP